MARKTATKGKTKGNAATKPAGMKSLANIGVTTPARSALLLPESYEDLTRWVTRSSDLVPGQRAVVAARIIRGIRRGNARNGAPKTTVQVELADGTCFTPVWMGDTKKFHEYLEEGAFIVLAGVATEWGGHKGMMNPRVVDSRWMGRCLPVYPTPHRTGQDTVKQQVMPAVKTHGKRAARMLQHTLPDTFTEREILARIKADPAVPSLHKLLIRAHFPKQVEHGIKAAEALDRLAAWVAIEAVIRERDSMPLRQPLAIDVEAAMRPLPVKLTGEQVDAIRRMQRVLSLPRAGQMLLSGDVGTGKTFVYLVAAAAVVAAGGRVAILLPTSVLAKQTYEQAVKLYPEIPSLLVEANSRADLKAAQLLVGTTALLHRATGKIDLIVCDEQQKMGAEQRRAMSDAGTHRLDVTATAIPRTLALANYGVMETAHLKEGHTAKTIRTQCRTKDDLRALTIAVQNHVKRGERTLIVYSAIAHNSKRKVAVHSVEGVIDKWRKLFGDKVRMITGAMTEAEKIAAVEDLVSGKALIGICTILVEVGLNIPNMRRVVVVNPEQFGITSLHQLRGRLAREGGEGDCDLVLTHEVSDNAMARLRVFESTTDGMKIAEADLELRGAGELASNGKRQSGASYSILPGRELSKEAIDYIRSLPDIARRLEPPRYIENVPPPARDERAVPNRVPAPVAFSEPAFL